MKQFSMNVTIKANDAYKNSESKCPICDCIVLHLHINRDYINWRCDKCRHEEYYRNIVRNK